MENNRRNVLVIVCDQLRADFLGAYGCDFVPTPNIDALAENGVVFVDNSVICKELKHMWEPDGIHVVKTFYPHWGKNLVVAALEEGGIVDEDPVS
jgi:hypothetical protein